MGQMNPYIDTLAPWDADIPLNGPNAPENDGHIEHLIRYLRTVHKRFGNTAVTVELQWGASALWKRDEQQATIAERDATIERLVWEDGVACSGGCGALKNEPEHSEHLSDCSVLAALEEGHDG